LDFKVSNYFKKLSESANPNVCLPCRLMTAPHDRIKACQLVCIDSGVKFNIWDVVGARLPGIVEK